MRTFALPNLVSHHVDDRDPREPRNNDINITNKEHFRRWCNNKDLEHCFYSMSEGVGANWRVGAKNSIRRIHGLIVDYDSPIDGVDYERLAKLLPKELHPRYFHKTISGYGRLVFEFESPVLFQPDEVMDKFTTILKRKLKLALLFPGLDDNALRDYRKYYEQGFGWEEVSKNKIDSNLLTGWVEEASRTYKWGEEAISIPMERIAEEGERQYPGAIDWKAVEEGFRCHRFWDPDADAQSVIVRESGCQCYTGDVSFMSWSALFGNDFVNQFRDTQLSAAIEGIYFDGKDYWNNLPGLGWVDIKKPSVENFLAVSRGLSRGRRKGAPSEVEQAMNMLERRRRVVAAFPFLYRKGDVVESNGGPWLNISSITPIQPIEEAVEWGDGFPWLSQYLATVFNPYKQRDFFLSWASHFYVSALESNLRSGLTLIIAGPTGVGKNFLTDVVLGQLMGGFTPAESYLVEGQPYNGELFPKPIWTAHDSITPTDYAAHRKFTQLVKKVAANESLEYRPMYRAAREQEWRGRTIITMNDDPNSLALLPQTDGNILDKIAMLRMQRPQVDYFPSQKEIKDELPYFARYLVQFGVHEDWKGSQRFGVKPYHQPTLLEVARQESPSHIFEETLDMWRESIPDGEVWEGSGSQLALDVQEYMGRTLTASLSRGFSPVVVGRHLNQLVEQGCSYIERKRVKGRRIWRITK